MGRPCIDMAGKRYGRLVGICRVSTVLKHGARWLFQCDCGNQHTAYTSHVRQGAVTSCGCFQREVSSARLKGKPSPKLKELTGDKFGQWTVVRRAENHSSSRGRKYTYWTCECSCGAIKDVAAQALTEGLSASCGCRRAGVNMTHGETGSTEYRSWQSMLRRCRKSTCPEYKYYGGRGIRVTPAWLSFGRFFADMGRKPTPGHSLDRIDVDGNYEPDNCRWATKSEQMANRRSVAGLQDELARLRSLAATNFSIAGVLAEAA